MWSAKRLTSWSLPAIGSEMMTVRNDRFGSIQLKIKRIEAVGDAHANAAAGRDKTRAERNC